MTEAVIEAQTENYRVQTEVFNGPLDLLLYLIKKEEVDIYDIPIARITNQYLRYVEMMKTPDLEVAGEFILMAATLIRIKTRLLLPQDETDADDSDPREELIMALVEYKKYKEASDILKDKALLESQRYVPPSPVERIEGRMDLTPMTSLYDLVLAFKEVLSSQRHEIVHEVDIEAVSIEDRMLVILQRLADKESAVFQDLFMDMPHKIVAVVTFVALLELVRARRVRVFQAVPFSEIRVYRGEQFEAPAQDIDLVDYPTALQQVT